nr:nuclease associated modular domain 3 [Tanacetum cinerariifolium]
MRILLEKLLCSETGNSGSARAVPDKDGILKDASEIEKIGVNGVVETANFGEASLHMNVNGIGHEKLSSSSLLTSSSWTDISLKMMEVDQMVRNSQRKQMTKMYRL